MPTQGRSLGTVIPAAQLLSLGACTALAMGAISSVQTFEGLRSRWIAESKARRDQGRAVSEKLRELDSTAGVSAAFRDDVNERFDEQESVLSSRREELETNAVKIFRRNPPAWARHLARSFGIDATTDLAGSSRKSLFLQAATIARSYRRDYGVRTDDILGTVPDIASVRRYQSHTAAYLDIEALRPDTLGDAGSSTARVGPTRAAVIAEPPRRLSPRATPNPSIA